MGYFVMFRIGHEEIYNLHKRGQVSSMLPKLRQTIRDLMVKYPSFVPFGHTGSFGAARGEPPAYMPFFIELSSSFPAEKFYMSCLSYDGMQFVLYEVTNGTCKVLAEFSLIDSDGVIGDELAIRKYLNADGDVFDAEIRFDISHLVC